MRFNLCVPAYLPNKKQKAGKLQDKYFIEMSNRQRIGTQNFITKIILVTYYNVRLAIFVYAMNNTGIF